jgi:hypothetical protein
MNQARDLARDGLQRPVERGVSAQVVREAADQIEREYQVEKDSEIVRQEKAGAKRGQKSAQLAAQRAEMQKEAGGHQMSTRSKAHIDQPGKFGRDQQRHY